MSATVATFTVTIKDEAGGDQAVDLAIIRPSPRTSQRAQFFRAQVYGEAVRAKVPLKRDLVNMLRQQGIWGDPQQAEEDRLRRAILDGELQLARGGIRKPAARVIALQMSRDRVAFNALRSVFVDAERHTADAMADQSHFDFLVAHCTRYSGGPRDGQPYFTKDGRDGSVDDYLERQEDPAAAAAAEKLGDLLYGSIEGVRAAFPENKFLRDYGFVDAKYRLVNKAGELVDEDGRRVDDEGYYLDENGNRVDREGNPIAADGGYAVTFVPFIDDETEEGAPAS